MPSQPTSHAGAKPWRPSPAVLVLAPVPGVGHWLIRRAGRGLLVFMAFAFGVNLILLSGIIAPAGPLSPVLGWILACAAVLFSLFDVTRIVLKSRADPVKSR